MKMRKFEGGGNTRSDDPSKNQYVDTDDIEYKAIGLKASNAELERGERKQSGFLGLGRLFQGDINQKGSEAYNLYGAGYGREVEAKNDRLKAATLKKAADDEARDAAAARDAKAAASEDNPEKRFFGAGANNRPSAAELAAASAARAAAMARDAARDAARGAASTESGSDYRGPMERRKLDVSEPASTGSAPVKASTRSAPVKASTRSAPASTGSAPASTGSAPASTSASDYRGPMQRMKLDVSEPARAAAAAKAAADAPKVRNPDTDEGEDVRPASQAQLKALAAIARATGSTSGVASGRVTAAEAARKIAEYAKKAGGAASSYVGELEFPGERRLRLAKEAKAKETASFNRERGDRATGGVIKSYAKGGSVSASSRGDGIAQRGKTRGRMC